MALRETESVFQAKTDLFLQHKQYTVYTVSSLKFSISFNFNFFTYFIGLLSMFRGCLFPKGVKRDCLRNEFSDIVLIIVYNFPFYSSITTLTNLYKKAFPSIMFCGSRKSKNHTVEALYIHRGYFAYTCMSRAMEKYPGYSGYLVINDDVMLNYWNLIGLNRDRIWEGPKRVIRFQNYSLPQRWYWWNSTWGMKSCQKAYNELQALHKANPDEWQPEINVTYHLKKNGNGTFYCYRGRSDVYYIPGKFADTFRTLSYVFFKHGTFLEIAVPTICRMLDLAENFEYISGIYLPGKAGEAPVRKAMHFWEVYDKQLAFIHPLKLNYKDDGALNLVLLRKWITEYSDTLSKCERK